MNCKRRGKESSGQYILGRTEGNHATSLYQPFGPWLSDPLKTHVKSDLTSTQCVVNINNQTG